MKFIGIIPARYASTRFPGKPLAMLGGKPVIQHVYEKVAAVLEEAYVATDDERIFNAVEAFGGKAVMTRTDHKSGTDRIEEAIEKIGGDWDVIVNVQGDEPFVAKSQLETICHCFDDPTTQIATLLRIQTVRKSQSATRDSLSTSPAASSHTYEVKSERSGSSISLTSSIWASTPIARKCSER